jgi:hypothetical protein
MTLRRSGAVAVAAALLLAGCASAGSGGGASSDNPSRTSESFSAPAAPSGSPSSDALASTGAAPSPTGGSSGIVNAWVAPGSVSVTALPLGDGHSSTSGPAIGSVYACRAGNPAAGGADVDGPWIHGTTWNSAEKVVVQGSVTWPTASFSVSLSGASRIITTNDLPTGYRTGTFPIASTDPAYQYDRNPNSISSASSYTITLPAVPSAEATPNCVSGGGIGVLLNGVVLFDALDGPGRDAVAHEEQDLCQGHPQGQDIYHYHEIPTCLRDNASGTSEVVGWAFDGFPIVVERDAKGNLPTNADLDECHGRTSPVVVDGSAQTMYHYDATLEFPYSIGCLRGSVVAPSSSIN